MVFTFEMFLSLALIIFSIIGYSWKKFPIDAVSISVLGLLLLLFEIFQVNYYLFTALNDSSKASIVLSISSSL